MPAAASPQPTPRPAADGLAAWSRPFAGWDPNAASELMGAWTCAYGIWGAYVARLATATSLLAVYDAGAQLMTDSLDICSRAAGARLRDGGLRAPLLNDA